MNCKKNKQLKDENRTLPQDTELMYDDDKSITAGSNVHSKWEIVKSRKNKKHKFEEGPEPVDLINQFEPIFIEKQTET